MTGCPTATTATATATTTATATATTTTTAAVSSPTPSSASLRSSCSAERAKSQGVTLNLADWVMWRGGCARPAMPSHRSARPFGDDS